MTQYVRAINIANNSIKSFVFDTNTSNTLNTAAVASAVAISANVSAQAVNTFVTLQTLQVANTPPTINTISITDSSYNILDDTAANTGGAYLAITGTNFQSGAIVMVGSSNTALSTTFVDSNNLRAQIPAIAAGTYPVYVVNTNGGTAIRINGLTTSPFPAWSTGATLTGQNNDTPFGINLSASSDSNITYSNTTALPAGTTLAANGYFSGSLNPVSNTTYSFDVKATDAENQDATRTFSITITVTPSYKLWSWGDNDQGQLGLNDTAKRSSPVQIGSNKNWSSVESGAGYLNLGLKSDGTLWSWGYNNAGQLGTNDTINRSSPTQIGTETNWSKISLEKADVNRAGAIKTDGTLWTWGSNGYGGLGLNIAQSNYKSSPTQVGTGTDWNSVSAGRTFAAIKTGGTLWLWGQGNYGATGQNNIITRSSPVQVGTNTNWAKVYSSGAAMYAIKTNGTLWAWGSNFLGQLGTNNTIYRSSPVQIGTDTNWSSMSVANAWAAGLKSDGTLWTWGVNQYQGQLGQNNIINRSSPVQVGTGTNWSQIAAAGEWMVALKTDGTLWTWGNNSNGQLGLNDRVYRSSPVQIGTATNWNLISTSKAITLN
jgi:alpha-tubulin suppressor-like RCC1 family protein